MVCDSQLRSWNVKIGLVLFCDKKEVGFSRTVEDRKGRTSRDGCARRVVVVVGGVDGKFGEAGKKLVNAGGQPREESRARLDRTGEDQSHNFLSSVLSIYFPVSVCANSIDALRNFSATTSRRGGWFWCWSWSWVRVDARQRTIVRNNERAQFHHDAAHASQVGR